MRKFLTRRLSDNAILENSGVKNKGLTVPQLDKKSIPGQSPRAKIQLLILGLIIVGMITVAGNVSLAVNKSGVEKEVDGCFTHDISIGPVFYIFPNYIVLNNIIIRQTQASSKDSSFVLSKMVLRFSFREMLFNGFLNVSKVTMYPSEVNYYALSRFLEDNFQEILEIIRNSPGNDITIRIKETLLDFDRKGQPDYIAMELLLKIQDDYMEGTGFFRADQYSFSGPKAGKVQRIAQGWPLWYRLESRLKPDGLEIDRLIFKSGNLHSKLWGSIRGGIVKINGFTFMNTAKKHFDKEEYSSSRYFKDFPDDEELSNVDTYILDINGRVKLDFPEITIEKFNFTLNNIPVSLQGNVSLADPLSVDAELSFYGAHVSGGKKPFFKKADISLSGTWKDQVFNANGETYIDFIDHKDLSLSPESAQIGFQGLSFYFDRHKRPNIDLANVEIVYWTNKNEHKISVRDVKTAGNTKMEGLKLVEVDAPFYGGSLNGRIWIDPAQSPSKVTSLIVLTDVDTDAMEELLIHFAKFNGRMSSKMNFTNIPRLNLSGDITVYDGTLTDFAFFNWLGDSFRLPDLKAIDFGRASARFSINNEHIQLRDIRLKTEDVRIGGYFDVDSKNLVSSKLFLALSQDLLRESPKFKPVLKMFEDDDHHLGFDFQLSGNMSAMNFQWLPSEVKRKIQARIPDFIERMIERDVDAMMDPTPGRSKGRN